MPDYEEMYLILFRETTKAIAALQQAQQRAEALYIAGDIKDNLIIIGPGSKDKAKKHPPQG